jgi:hypothetical protein
MIEKAIKELQKEIGFDEVELNLLRVVMEEIAAESYGIGYADRRLDEQVEDQYYSGFSYGKKEDQ